MPFSVGWSETAKRQFHDFEPHQRQLVRQVVGGFQHDRWRIGHQLMVDDGPPEAELRALANQAVILVYDLDESKQHVQIVALLESK